MVYRNRDALAIEGRKIAVEDHIMLHIEMLDGQCKSQELYR